MRFILENILYKEDSTKNIFFYKKNIFAPNQFKYLIKRCKLIKYIPSLFLIYVIFFSSTFECIYANTENIIDAVEPFGSLHGVVKIIENRGRKNKKIEYPPINVILDLIPLDENALIKKKESKEHVVDMMNKKFMPRYKIIRVGDQVSFLNSDSFNHNVFSLTTKSEFDLGSYGSGVSHAVRFSNPGLIKIYCNVHSSMAFFLYVSPGRWHTMTNSKGQFVIDRVPPGSYKLYGWHLTAEKEVSVRVVAGENKKINFTLYVKNFKFKPHKNKYGKGYEELESDEDY